MTTENPYSAPLEMSDAVVKETIVNATDKESLIALAKSVFLTWEKLRLLYVAILAVVSLLAITGSIWLQGYFVKTQANAPPIVITLVFGAVVANVCYFAGPILETYVRWLGFRTYWLRVCLFVTGTVAVSALAVVALFLSS